MKQQNTPATAPQKLSYEPPKATFVPLKIEERLLTCSKLKNVCEARTPGYNENKS